MNLKGLIFLSAALTGVSVTYGKLDISIYENGDDVEATFSGSFNTAATTSTFSSAKSSGIVTSDIGSYSSLYITLGPGTATAQSAHDVNTSGPTAFGTNGNFQAHSYSLAGDVFNFTPFLNSSSSGEISLPEGYLSGSFISGGSVFSGQTLDSMGLTAGSYEWTVGNDGFTITDTITLNVSAVPEPATFALIAGCLGLTWVMLRRRG